VVGAAALPALGEEYWAATGRGAFRNGEALRVSNVDAWSNATLSLGEMRLLFAPPRADGALSLLRTAASARGYGDLAAALMVLDGRADVWLEAGVQIWDIAPMKVLFEEAGGAFSDFAGAPSIAGGCAVGSNGRLHAHVLAALRSPPPPR
jgi:histidinol-phosphatase